VSQVLGPAAASLSVVLTRCLSRCHRHHCSSLWQWHARTYGRRERERVRRVCDTDVARRRGWNLSVPN